MKSKLGRFFKFIPSIIVVFIVVADNCSLGFQYKMTPEAFIYLTRALDIIQENFYRKSEINWPNLRSQAYQTSMGALTTLDTYPSIRVVIEQLHEGHTVFWGPGQFNQYLSNDQGLLPSGHSIGTKVAYINLPGTMGMEKGAMYTYAQKAQELIRQMDNHRNCGWIIDLRSETGGNMWGVLAGVGPLLGEGELGYFLYPDGNKLRWYYENGEAKYGDSVAIDMGNDRYSLKRPNPPVAILVDTMTTSAGEAVAVAFRGRDKTRFFGVPTKGFSTTNQLFYLSDQASIMLTVAVDADRTGKTYGGAIIPDEIVKPAKGEPKVIDAALVWLLSLPDCQ